MSEPSSNAPDPAAAPGPDRASRPWALVPVKSPRDAKSRLAAVLGPAERAALVEHMLRDVLAALRSCTRLAGIALITPDSEVAALAEREGAHPLEEDPREERPGPNAAIRQARHLLAQRGATAMLVVPGDVPLLTGAAVARLLDALPATGGVVIAPDAARVGTNALLCAPPGLIDPAFGPGSFVEHQARARRAGVEPIVLALPELALDLDEPADLRRLLQARASAGAPCRTIRYLDDAGLAQRIAPPEGQVEGALPAPGPPDP
ncbi:MAG TPA: 2-phospho-L-lactate guanylyltransferase [Thermoanaerobaculia bacterium]|nr:2-phospho-L-lactate guanylyltransferase [Thermoanaerobaculia bacterium]